MSDHAFLPFGRMAGKGKESPESGISVLCYNASMDITKALFLIYVVAAASAFAILLLIPVLGEWTLLLGIIWIGVVSIAANSVRCQTCGKPVTRRELSADTRSVAPWSGSAFVTPWPETVCSRCGTVLISSKPDGSPDESA
jgi:hypothetical protein